MRHLLHRWLDSSGEAMPVAPKIGALLSLALGLVFVFVWTPHPWGWHGIDQYHELSRGLVRGEGFATTDVPWGYAYFIAAFYAVFGERAWIPVTAQVIANATIPLMLYRLVQPFASARVAALASLLVGAFSFNTVYASTQSSDSMCTVLFVAALLCFSRAHLTSGWTSLALSGLLMGTVPQFRPNMLLFPALLAAALVLVSRRKAQAVARMGVFLALVAVALAPWVIRNYRLTGAILPTSTHGGVQLWYGTLQVGPYLESRAYNPRSVFEASAFDYTTMVGQSIVFTALRPPCEPVDDTEVTLAYSTDRDRQPIRVAPRRRNDDQLVFEIPGQPADTAVYYQFETQWTADGQRRRAEIPDPGGSSVFFVTTEHLTDLDRHGDLLDVFDLVRLVRLVAWGDASSTSRIDKNGDGTMDEADLRLAVVRLLGNGATLQNAFAEPLLAVTDREATLRLADGSTLTVPAGFSGKVTDLEVRGDMAGSLVSARRAMRPAEPLSGVEACHRVWDVAVNEVFYRKEPHMMRRYMTLAADNITREPWAFAKASLYRLGRLFVIRGTGDVNTTQQFAGSRSVYFGGMALSALYLLLFAGGVAVAWRARSPLRMYLLPIVYVPVTICFVLTNMRYTITVQPLMFVFVALAIDAVLFSGSLPQKDDAARDGVA